MCYELQDRFKYMAHIYELGTKPIFAANFH